MSWWIGVSREDWPRVVALRQPVLSTSEFGRKLTLTNTDSIPYAPDTEKKWRSSRLAMVQDLERRRIA